jgi:hypothetical protein
MPLGEMAETPIWKVVVDGPDRLRVEGTLPQAQ